MGSGCGKTKNDSVVECKSSYILDNKSMFTFLRIIGKGGFGRVWKVTDKKSKQAYAMKVIDKARVITKKSVQSVINER
jgi:serine/threonine protein kinase